MLFRFSKHWSIFPRHLIRDRDRIYGSVVTGRLRTMASGTNLSRQAHPGRTALPNGWLDRSGVNAWTTSLSWVRCICPGSWKQNASIL